MADLVEKISTNDARLKDVKLMVQKNGVIFTYDKDKKLEQALEDILKLLKYYYQGVFYAENPSALPYKPPEHFSIKPVDTSKYKKDKHLGRVNLVMKGKYKRFALIRGSFHQRDYEAVLGFFDIWAVTIGNYATYALAFYMRERVLLGGKFEKNIDKTITEQEATGFLEYVKSKKAQAPASQPYFLQK